MGGGGFSRAEVAGFVDTPPVSPTAPSSGAERLQLSYPAASWAALAPPTASSSTVRNATAVVRWQTTLIFEFGGARVRPLQSLPPPLGSQALCSRVLES